MQKLLRTAIDAEFAGSGPDVSLKTPKEMNGSNGISLWLYRVVRDEFLNNQPPEQSVTRQLRRVPLPVRLHYLVTPLMGDDSETEQQLLGKVLQVFHDRPTIRGTALQDGLDPA